MDKLTKEEASQIFLQNIELVRTIAARRAPARSLQEDIVQDTYVYFVNKSENWDRREPSFKGLLKTIAQNMAARHWDQWIRNLPENLQAVAEYLTRASESLSGPENLTAEEKVYALKICLQKLSPENRDLIEMFYYGNVSYSDLVKKTGRSIDALYMQMSRIRALLHDCILKTMTLEVDDV
ncbi:MAG: sigma-70 family RNA polymerase sigma factor [Planctomycetia bacterium]|nr:sigma-70 family RNA polymerase sigma factor [Planctomycetia bacterium]